MSLVKIKETFITDPQGTAGVCTTFTRVAMFDVTQSHPDGSPVLPTGAVALPEGDSTLESDWKEEGK